MSRRNMWYNSVILNIVLVILTACFAIGCASSDKNNLPPKGTIDSPANEIIIVVGGTVRFSGSGNDPESDTSLTYQWDFGGGASNSAEEDPGDVAFNTPGNYTITLTVTDSLGAADQTPATVLVKVVYFFAATDELHGTELWVTDGAEAGTRLFKDINPGLEVSTYPGNSYPANFLYINGAAFFFARDAVHGTELWKSDGTKAGTLMVADIYPSAYSSVDTLNYPNNFISIDSTLFFFANDGTHGTELWKSDGTNAGTVMIKDINLSEGSINFDSKLTNSNGVLFFSADDGTHGIELWKSDGTVAGTVMVKDINPGTIGSIPSKIIDVNGVIFFWADNGINGYELWKSDGTETGTVLVKDIYPGFDGSYPCINSRSSFLFANVNGTLFFFAYDPANGAELWKSDGTEEGTVLVKDINTGAGGVLGNCSNSLIADDNTLFFTANDGINGMELWRSDGTEVGTRMVKDIHITSGSWPHNLTRVNNTLYFRAFNGESDGLWKSDGTATGTVSIKDFFPIWVWTLPEHSAGIMNVHSTFFFFAEDGTTGTEFWRSDGTEAGTVLVKDIDPAGSSYPSQLTNVNGTLYFSANDGEHGMELWKSNGTDAETVMVKEIGPYEYFPIYNLINVNGTLFFSADDGEHGLELWKSNGTEAGTSLIRDIDPGLRSSQPENFININGTLFFTAHSFHTDDIYYPNGLWKSDGTNLGTTFITDSNDIHNLTDVDGVLFYLRNGALWKSDGTEVGTILVRELPEYRGYNHNTFTNLNGTLFFFIETSTGDELWKSDGTYNGTVIVKELYNYENHTRSKDSIKSGGTLFLDYADGTHGRELWKSDGTEAGTVMVKDINPGSGYSSIEFKTDVNGILFFVANDGANGWELWKSDGTEDGTVMVKVINPEGPSYINNLINVNGTLFFVANDGANGWELWKSDGTEDGTILVKDINPNGNAFPSYIFWGNHFADVSGTLFFFASDGINGIELWKSDGTEAGTIMVKDINKNQNQPYLFL